MEDFAASLPAKAVDWYILQTEVQCVRAWGESAAEPQYVQYEWLSELTVTVAFENVVGRRQPEYRKELSWFGAPFQAEEGDDGWT